MPVTKGVAMIDELCDLFHVHITYLLQQIL